MEIKLLIDAINSKISFRDFLDIHKNELKSYIYNSKSNDVVPIYSNDINLKINKNDIIRIFEYYLKKEILEWDLEFILSNLELTYDGEDENVEEIIYYFANPYLNYFISIDNIKKAIVYLQDCNKSIKLDATSLKLKQKGEDIRPNYNSKLKFI